MPKIFLWQLEVQFDVVSVKSQIKKLAEMIALAHITKYSNIFVRNLRIFEYIRIPIFLYSYSNIKYSARNIRIFEYIRIFATLCHNSVSVLVEPFTWCLLVW